MQGQENEYKRGSPNNAFKENGGASKGVFFWGFDSTMQPSRFLVRDLRKIFLLKFSNFQSSESLSLKL